MTTLSIIVPAFNEEKLIVASIRHVAEACARALPGDWRHELIVVDNNSTDRTAELARAEGAKIVFEGKNQIARARNRGAAEAAGDWLLFIDADSTLSAEVLADTVAAMGNDKVIAGGALIRFPDDAPAVCRYCTALWTRISRTFHWMAGSYIFCRAEVFRAVGGFSEELYASEEIDLSKRLKRLARARAMDIVILTRHPVLTSDRKLRLYGWRDQLRFLFWSLVSVRKMLRDPKRCYAWYDGRR